MVIIMEYVLFSCGKIKEILIKKGLKPKYIVSFDANEYDTDNIKSIYKLRKNYNNEKILIPSYISDDIDVDDIYRQFIDLGFENESILFIPIEIILGSSEIDFKSFYKYSEKTYLNYLEINIIDSCNMNCKGCSHFANLALKEIKSFDKYYADFIRLKELIPHIFKIRIMGGEPFLNPDLPRYIRMIKDIYPYTDLRVVTNGLLLKNINEDMIKCLIKNNVMLDVSVYPPLYNTIDELLNKLKEKKVKIFLEHITRFKPILLEKSQSYPYEKLRDCDYINLQNGCLAACPLPFTINYINNKYENKYDKKCNLINIYDDVSGFEIKERLKEPFELCDFCAHYRNDLPFFDWKQKVNDFKLEDWVYKKEKKNGIKVLQRKI